MSETDLYPCQNGFIAVFSEECSSYRVLNEQNRAQTYALVNSLCDSGLSVGWYRFSGAAGNQMPEQCTRAYRCGTHRTGWLNGNHPSAADGIVSREVCYSLSGCCMVAYYISVRNCTGFYVYRLQPTPACNFRYCGNGVPGASRFLSNFQYQIKPIFHIYPGKLTSNARIS